MGDANREEIAKLEALYANNPGGRVFTHLAEAYRKAGELDRARAILEDGLARHSDSASAHVVLGRVLLDQGATSGASSAFRRVLELDPENRVALRTLGDLSRGSGRRDEALDYYSRLQQLDPGDDDLASLIGRLTEEAAVPVAEEPADAPAAEQAEPEHAEPASKAASAEAVAETVSAETTLDWTAAEPESQEALPGDLAQFAQDSEEAADRPSLEEVPRNAAEETSVETLQVQSAFEEISASVPEAETASAFEEIEQASAVSSESGWSGFEPPSETAAEAPAELTFTREEQVTDEPWNQPAGAAEFASAADSAVDGTFGAAPEDTGDAQESAEAWSDLPATFEEPEILSTSLETEPEDPTFGEPWTDSIDLSVSAETVEEQEPEPLEFYDPSVDPAAEEARETSFEEMLSSNVAEGTGPAETSEEDLPTETLAELYRTQGFYDRSIEIYRALLVEHPDDVRLQARLQEVEDLEEKQRAGDAAVAQESPAQEEEDAGEAWMAGVASAWTGEETHAPGLYSWTDESGDSSESPGPLLSEYMTRLLSWRPVTATRETAVVQEVTTVEAEVHAPAAEEADEPWAEPGGEAPVAEQEPDEPWSALESEAPAPVRPNADQEFGIEHDLPTLTLDEEVPNEPGLAASLMDWQPPVEEGTAPEFAEPSAPATSAYADAPASAENPPVAATRASSGNPVEDAFDEWFNADDAPSAQDRPAESAASQPATFADAPQSVPEGPPSAEESDDDLEMFRSWLQSLKR